MEKHDGHFRDGSEKNIPVGGNDLEWPSSSSIPFLASGDGQRIIKIGDGRRRKLLSSI
jgi:hypothetical protein